MKNTLLKSLVIFVVMSLLHSQFADWAVKLLGLPGGDFGMYSYLILIFCSLITGVGLVTVIIFRKSYHSILRIVILFEVIYLIFLIISGNNPFLYFTDPISKNLLTILMYTNALIILFIMFIVEKFYSNLFQKNC